jgi:hypothetical protein
VELVVHLQPVDLRVPRLWRRRLVPSRRHGRYVRRRRPTAGPRTETEVGSYASHARIRPSSELLVPCADAITRRGAQLSSVPVGLGQR